jgi:hypothetical protein
MVVDMDEWKKKNKVDNKFTLETLSKEDVTEEIAGKEERVALKRKKDTGGPKTSKNKLESLVDLGEAEVENSNWKILCWRRLPT